MSPASPFFPSAASRDSTHRVLCVDDDPVCQRLLIAALARPGFTVECVCDGQQALDRLASDERGFDVLVTDHAMPRMDGLGLVQALCERRYLGPVIVVSASLRAADRQGYRAFGVRRMLLKPIDVPALRAAVDAVLSGTAAGPAARPLQAAGQPSRAGRAPRSARAERPVPPVATRRADA